MVKEKHVWLSDALGMLIGTWWFRNKNRLLPCRFEGSVILSHAQGYCISDNQWFQFFRFQMMTVLEQQKRKDSGSKHITQITSQQ